jgi:hypothetical protein
VLAIAASAAWIAACGPAPGNTVAPVALDTATRGTACGPAVTRTGQVLRVVPTGADDTASLQCAFDLAAARPGSSVRLGRGTFASGALFIHGLVGEVRGEGEGETLVVNIPVIQVNPDMWTSGAPPSGTNVYPFLWTFAGGRFAIHHLTFRIQGAAPTTGWKVPGVDATIDSMAAAVSVTGQGVRAEVHHVAFEGEANPLDPLFGYNLYNGVFFEALPFDGPPATGRFSVHACRFQSMASWAPLYRVADAVVQVTGNDAADVFFALDVLDVARSTVLYGANRVQRAQIAQVGEGGAIDGSLVVLTGNRFEAAQGLLIDGPLTGGTHCLVAGNWIDPPAAGITLGPATSNCLVAGNHGATVVDQGAGNHVVGR